MTQSAASIIADARERLLAVVDAVDAVDAEVVKVPATTMKEIEA